MLYLVQRSLSLYHFRHRKWLNGGQHESDSTISEDDVIEEGDNDEYKDSWDFKRI